MRLTSTVIAVATALVALPSLATAATQDPTHGYWLTENGKAIVHFAPCGDQTCGKMVWMDRPLAETGDLKRDVQNADEAKRARPICGLALVGGLHRAKTGSWEGGWIYSPRDGKTYSAKVNALSSDELTVRGYLGLELLGKSQVWTRVPDDRGGC